MKKLKTYSAATCFEGPYLLVFAHTIREAKKIAWPVMQGFGAEEYIDIRVRFEKDMPWLWKEKESDGPHYIEPKICNTCEMWGQSEIIDGLCEDCRKGGHENFFDENDISPETVVHG